MAMLQSPPSSRLEQILQNAEPITDARSERMLAVALGYPLTWHVVRLPDKTDVIYAGNPSWQKNLALCLNHDAARRAAEIWDPESSSPYRGGQSLPRQPRFRKNDKVEVLYEDEWYPATIVKHRDYEDKYRDRYG